MAIDSLTRVAEIPYRSDSTQLFGHLVDLPYSVFLDSGYGSAFAGRFDILAAEPSVVLSTSGGWTEIRRAGGSAHSDEDPLTLLRRHLGARIRSTDSLPFAGGAIGCFAYDLGRRFERMTEIAARDIEFPEMLIGIYDAAFVVDHFEQRSYLVSSERDSVTRERWRELLDLGAQPPAARPRSFEVVSGIRANFTPESYRAAFERVQEHIRVGDCYQVNLAQRFEARVRGDSWAAYQALRSINPAPFSCFMRTPEGDVLSSSPERFLKLDGAIVEAKPIKGTRPRSQNPRLDESLRAELACSVKDRAENVMIVDLLRNDLGKACEPGSVSVTKLFDIESFAHVHHMVSTVAGRLAPSCDALDLLRACFPGGSITGAPKLRAMEIIDALEPQRRSIYCGGIGYLSHCGRMDLNIAIRSLLRVDDSIYAWAGGGIVADSNCEAEFQESMDKVSGLLAILDGTSISAAS
jgi:para-aminobenzoate synthetase component 1